MNEPSLHHHHPSLVACSDQQLAAILKKGLRKKTRVDVSYGRIEGVAMVNSEI
jgi:uncharacterized protein (UPF0254 family)